MHSLDVIAVDDTALYDGVTVAKRGDNQTQLRSARPTILEAYQSYSDRAPALETLPDIHLTTHQESALRHAFEVETVPLGLLRARLLDDEVDGATCPFCGMGETSTLDHYLPKEDFPQFAIFSRNLIPACASCNTLKRDRLLDEQTNVRLFLHPYFDAVPTASFLRVDIVLAPQALLLNFHLTRPHGLRQQTFRQLESHFQLLRLNRRYRRRALARLGDQFRPLQRAFGATRDTDRVAAWLSEPGLQLKSYLVLRADQSSRLVNEFGRAFLKKVLPNAKIADSNGQMLLKL